MSSGKLFQTAGAACEKAQPAKVDRRKMTTNATTTTTTTTTSVTNMHVCMYA